MWNFLGPTKRRETVALGIGLVTLSFVACGGRTDLNPPSGDASGSAGLAGVGAEGGLGGATGRGGSVSPGGSLGRGGSLGSFGGPSGGGSDGFGGIGGAAVGGASGSFGAGGTPACVPKPNYECQWCSCGSCPDQWARCRSNGGCAEIMDCVAANGCEFLTCYQEGLCREVIDRTGGPRSSAAALAFDLDNCGRNLGCTCSGGFGGASGFGGSAGFGGAGGFGGTFGGASGFGGSSGECSSFPFDPCGTCLCKSCISQWNECARDSRCVDWQPAH